MIERRTVPTANRFADGSVIVGTTEHVDDASPVMRKIRMQLNPSAVPRFVKPHQRIAQLRCSAFVDTQIPFTAKDGQRPPLKQYPLESRQKPGAAKKAVAEETR